MVIWRLLLALITLLIIGGGVLFYCCMKKKIEKIEQKDGLIRGDYLNANSGLGDEDIIRPSGKNKKENGVATDSSTDLRMNSAGKKFEKDSGATKDTLRMSNAPKNKVSIDP